MKGEYDGTKVLVWPLQIPSLFNHRCLTECMLLEETTSRHQWKIVYLTGKRGWDKSPSLSIFFGLSSKTQWLSGLYYADFISFYSPTQLCGGGTTKSNSKELPISVPLSFFVISLRHLQQRDHLLLQHLRMLDEEFYRKLCGRSFLYQAF